MDYKLYAVRVFVTDWERAIRFYTEILGMRPTYRSDEIGWAQMATGEGQLALERVDPSDQEGKALVGRFVGVSLQVPGHIRNLQNSRGARCGVRRSTREATLGRRAGSFTRSGWKCPDPSRRLWRRRKKLKAGAAAAETAQRAEYLISTLDKEKLHVVLRKRPRAHPI